MKLDKDFWSMQILIAEVLAIAGFLICAVWFLVVPVFYYQNAEINLKAFTTVASLEPIGCINGDSDRDWNLSCTARNKERLFAVSCGYMPWSKGCKVNFGQPNQSSSVQFSLFKE
jgi:hypothetical protein